MLRALGVELDADPGPALRARRRERARRILEPVLVRWSGHAPATRARVVARVRLPEDTGRIRATLLREDGGTRTWDGRPDQLAGTRPVDGDGERWVQGWLPLPDTLPDGYHRLTLEAGGRRHQALVIQAPRRVFGADAGSGRTWGVFAPLHALRRAGDRAAAARFGTGHFHDLADLAARVASLGGGLVATLPLLASFLDRPLEASPYAPVSRLFWNELFVDVERLPELASCEAARAVLASGEVRALDASLEGAATVDYRAAAAAKRRVMEPLARCFFESGGGEDEAYRAFLKRSADAGSYARFRAVVERWGVDIAAWPGRVRNGVIRDDAVSRDTVRFHLYAQFACERQLHAVADRAVASGVGLMLDLPLGAHGRGYDTWWGGDLFADAAQAGAPPDRFFESGQRWGFPPVRPDRSRALGHAYFRACLRHNMRHAAALRIDHVMGLHRLFWVPAGADPDDGAYVAYPAEELHAILSLESHRAGTAVIGEDLGTVPGSVRRAMNDHGVHRSYVAQFAVHAHGTEVLEPVPRHAIASVATHDTPTFSAWWHGADIRERGARGALGKTEVAAQAAHRAALRDALGTFLAGQGLAGGDARTDAGAALLGLLRYLAASEAAAVLVGLEDLWLETEPQNRPGLTDAHNWRRRLRLTLDEAFDDPHVRTALQGIARPGKE